MTGVKSTDNKEAPDRDFAALGTTESEWASEEVELIDVAPVAEKD